MIWGIATAHHPVGAALNATLDSSEQRRVWVPFHFIPGGEGQTLEEKLLCIKNSTIANQMFSNHVDVATSKKPFGLHLLGIAAHVYMDTFSHYGFSGVSSKYNEVKQETMDITENNWQGKSPDGQSILEYLENKRRKFQNLFVQTGAAFCEQGSRALGHAGVATYPDRPFLRWRFEYAENRLNNGSVSVRNNPETYLEGCQELHNHLSQFAQKYYNSSKRIEFSNIVDGVKKVLNYQGDKNQRINQWLEFIKARYNEDNVSYSHDAWKSQKEGAFDQYEDSASSIDTDIYRFYQAATYHRYYVLKDMLP